LGAALETGGSAVNRSLIAALLLLATPANAGSIFSAVSAINVTSIQVLNNVTAIVVSASPATFYGLEVSNNGATIAYVKVYNAASVTCGSGTPQARYMIPATTSVPLKTTNGDAYGAGITVCVTTGYADSDTGAPAANEYIVDVHYKRSNV
jgi:hypothetical protein